MSWSPQKDWISDNSGSSRRRAASSNIPLDSADPKRKRIEENTVENSSELEEDFEENDSDADNLRGVNPLETSLHLPIRKVDEDEDDDADYEENVQDSSSVESPSEDELVIADAAADLETTLKTEEDSDEDRDSADETAPVAGIDHVSRRTRASISAAAGVTANEADWSSVAGDETPRPRVDSTTSELQQVLENIQILGHREFILREKELKRSPLSLLRLFDVDVPVELEWDQDLLWRHLLSYLLANVRITRRRLSHFSSLDHAVALLQSSRRILVLTGAGVSVSCGIPDFRSENGIYRRLRDEYSLPDPESMFDISYFVTDPVPFFSFAKQLFPGNFKPSPSHYFIRLLEERGQLSRNYTQNIDTLEQVAGIQKIIQCHGSFATASCMRCRRRVLGESIREDIFAQRIPRCSVCLEADEKVRQLEKQRRKRKDESDDDTDADDGQSDPILKPDIVFFGEPLPDRFDLAFAEDRDQVDLLIVMGSSLKVHPVAGIIDWISPRVPQILINREPISEGHAFDIELLGDCDVIVPELVRRCGWRQEHLALMNEKMDEEDCSVSCYFLPPNRHVFQGAQLSTKRLHSSAEVTLANATWTEEDDDEDENVVE